MIVEQSYTRVTLALDIVRRIPDGPYRGFHELGSVKHKIDLCDTVGIEESATDAIECADPLVPRDERNTCLKVVSRLRKKFGIDRHVRITMEKRIPVQGGLAGGSANAATTISILNRLWGLHLSIAECIDLGRTIGMDIPFYFLGGSAFDSEAGLRLEPIDTGCTFTFLLACPEFGVPTAEAYAGLDYTRIGHERKRTQALCAALAAGDDKSVFRCMHNDFEESVFSRYPRLAAIKGELLSAGCSAAVLTGSGSTIIGIAADRRHAEAMRGALSCRTIIAETLK
jgi:4-diphosphocytidyl-2-C-methyl-D-erythritol kinase